MSEAVLPIIAYLLLLLLLVKPLGWYIARVYEGKSIGLNKILGPVERFIYRICHIQPNYEMSWKNYLFSMLFFNLFGMLTVYFILRIQRWLPFNPELFANIDPELAFNIAGSFVTNTNWQSYSAESTLSYLSQMLALTVQNFLSAATGMSLLIALIRGLVRHESDKLGNFWVDTVRGILYILLPLSFLLAIALSSQGVIQNVKPYETITLIQPTQHQDQQITQQVIPMGPVASQVAIKQIGSNGGGFFNTNSAHPFENPTAISNFLEMLSILLIPAALCYTFGLMVKDKRQGWVIFGAMMFLFVPYMSVSIISEQNGNPLLNSMNIEQSSGNMEGKETRIGVVNSALWASATTATSNGSVNSMHDSFTPLAGLTQLWLMHLGEIVFGGVGSGLYGMIMIIIISVFVAGLMVGRTPEYLGKKIEPFEMKMASFAVLLMPIIVLLLTAIGTVTRMGTDSILNPGAHGFSEILYAFTSMGNNNGSAFAGLNANTTFYNVAGALEMLALRYWIAIPVLAIAGSVVKKKIIPTSAGTLPTHTFLFMFLIISIALIIGALSFFPALALGPIVEQLMVGRHYGN